jgi:hypothetical protein
MFFFINFLFLNYRIKDALHDFIIFVPSNLRKSDDEDVINERNSIAILTRSCSKNQCRLEMELVLKKLDVQDEVEEDGASLNKYKFVVFLLENFF